MFAEGGIAESTLDISHTGPLSTFQPIPDIHKSTTSFFGTYRIGIERFEGKI
jgi:hypothetical protein